VESGLAAYGSAAGAPDLLVGSDVAATLIQRNYRGASIRGNMTSEPASAIALRTYSPDSDEPELHDYLEQDATQTVGFVSAGAAAGGAVAASTVTWADDLDMNDIDYSDYVVDDSEFLPEGGLVSEEELESRDDHDEVDEDDEDDEGKKKHTALKVAAGIGALGLVGAAAVKFTGVLDKSGDDVDAGAGQFDSMGQADAANATTPGPDASQAAQGASSGPPPNPQ